MELRVGKLGNGRAGLTESVFVEEDNHVVVLGTVGYGKGVDASSIPEESKVAVTLTALVVGDDLRSMPNED
ncbi:hypothetical protein [Azospirillum sp. A29]|uniref:hypothetical protein n=1 Tax=unclassified Azospirillum TaxID=2630922 RepID=UPI00366B4DD0